MSCNSGYQIASVTVDGGSVAVSSPYTFTNVVAAHTISLTCSAISVPSSIAAVRATYTAMAVRGTPHYFCDCGTGASGSCVAGSDSNDGLTTSTPKKTWSAAISTLNGLTSAGTVALCKGGAFNVSSATYLSNSHCTAGSTCFDLREFTPTTFTGTAKPIIADSVGTNVEVFNITNTGGFRVMNLRINGKSDTTGAFIYTSAHDITFGNVEMDGLSLAFYIADSNDNNITLTGSAITNSFGMGELGAASNTYITYNYWSNNGSDTNTDHTMYLSSETSATDGAQNVNVIGNYMEGAHDAVSDANAPCIGAMIVAHGAYTGVNITDNTLVQTAARTTGGCYGIALNDGNYYPTYRTFFRNTVVARNTVINTGSVGIAVSSCPACLVEDNLVIQDWAWGPGYAVAGIGAGDEAAAAGGKDDSNTAITFRNNTIWYGPTSNGGITAGIAIGAVEGNGYVFANNTITYTASSASQGVNCFDIGRGFANVSFMNNNHCNATSVTAVWEKTNGATRSAWQSYSGGLDSASLTSAPNFITPSSTYGSYNFKPNTGSPLISAGSHANAPTYDLTGVSTFGNPPDIGAYTH
jgi:hypothetical protein